MAPAEDLEEDPSALALMLKRKRSTKQTGDVCTFCLKKTKPPHDYATCPTRPCFLCRKQGHQQLDCPFRLLSGAQERALKELMSARARKSQAFHFVRAVELGRARPGDLHVAPPLVGARIAAVVRQAHSKRVTTLEFLPGEPCRRVISGDKTGTLAVWDFGEQAAHGTYGSDIVQAEVHTCNVNTLQFDGSHVMLSSSSDGRVCRTDLNYAGIPDTADVLLNLNPGGWKTEAEWRMAYGMATLGSSPGDTAAASSVLVGDDIGRLVAIDPRSSTPVQSSFAAHKKKIWHVAANPFRSNLLCTSSIDHTVRLWDIRKLRKNAELAVLKVGFSVASASFSPISGRKLLVTSLGSALQIYNDVDIFGSVSTPKPDHELVHGHLFNRYISVTKAVWDPKDTREDLFLCGRYLGESYKVRDYPKPLLLHPVDLFSASSGSLISSLVDRAVRTVCPVNRFHPTADLIVSGTSQNLFMWAPAGENAERLQTKEDAEAAAEGDEEDLSPSEKKRRVAAQVPETVVRRSGRRPRTRA